MLRTIVLISLIAVSNCLSFGQFDPDIDFCNDPNLSGGVVAEDGETYLFKGNYYWNTRPLTSDSGIVGYANLTASKWPEIKDKISLVFTVSQAKNLFTVFVVKNKWFAYQKGLKTMDGSVDDWPDFKNLKVTTAITPIYGGNLVYILYSDNNYFILYDFKTLLKPTKVKSGAATIRNNFIVFTEESAESMPGKSIRSLINVRAVLTYREKMFLLSRETFCSINLISQSYERECIPKDVNNILGCPLDISKRPALTTRKTESVSSQSTSKGSLETTSHSALIEEPFPSDWNFNETNIDPNSNQPIRTGIPILGRKLEEEDELDDNNTTAPIAPGLEADIIARNRKNSEFWEIAIIVVSVAIAITALLIAGVVYRVNRKKRQKGKEIVIN